MKEAWDVLQEDVSGSYLANQSEDVRPEPTLIFDPEFSTRHAPGLTWKSR
jgi:hypothetical protein